MGRRYSFSKLVTDIARDLAREQARRERERQKLQRAREREQEHARREAARLQTQSEREAAHLRAQLEKDAKQRYLEGRIKETEDKNTQLAERWNELQTILEHTLQVDDTLSFDSLRIHHEFPPFTLPPELQTPMHLPPQPETFLGSVQKPGFLESLIPGVEERYREALQKAEASYQAALEQYETEMASREMKIQYLRKEYEKRKRAFEQEVQQRNQVVSEFENAYCAGDPSAITAYCTLVLEQSQYPGGFPKEFQVAYVPESRQLVIEYELPNVEIVPVVAEYQYVKTKDTIKEKPHKATEIKNLYQDIVASVCLRTIHEVLEADQGNHLQVVAFNGFVQTVDRATGHDIRPCLISVRTIEDRFNDIYLNRIDKRTCLRNLGAQVSPRPDEMLPVKPIVEFDMVDRRFVEQSDVLSDLESRPNLMELNPFEFENLVSNLFGKLGFETKQTRSSRDGGIDAVAYDTRPILGGKVVIQAKRYKNTVGVSAVRDLYGTMINEGANKGILVTTSSYGPDAYDFAKDKPIELIDGGGLLYLLEQISVKARIVFPDE